MLLVEYTVLDELQVINEATAGGGKKLKLRGRFQKCDEQNNNGRIYPRKILEGQVKKIQEKIGDRSLVGALDHPANDAIHLSQASHLITGLSVDKSGDVIGECEILSTPNGKIVEALINDGVKIGISSRGVGSVSEGREGKIVNEDFKLITFDLVSDPSTKGAYPELTESIRENSERAQAIVSKHKKDRVLMTMLESKVSKALERVDEGEVKRRNKAKMRSGLAKLGAGALAKEKLFTPAERAGSYETYRKRGGKEQTGNVVGKGRAKLRKKFGQADDVGTIAKKKIAKGTTGVPPGPGDKKSSRTAMKYGSQNSSTDIFGKAMLEAFKKVCWGNRYNEATRLRKMSKGTPEEQKRARQEGAEMARRVGSHRKTNRALKKGKEVTDTRFAKQVVEGKIKDNPGAFKRAKAADDEKKSYVQRDQERQARLQQVIADNERRRIAAGGAGRDQSKPKKK